MYQFKNEQGWRRFDLSSPSRKDANLEMCQKVEEVLVKKGFHVNPKLFLHKDLTKDEKETVRNFSFRIFQVVPLGFQEIFLHLLFGIF